MNSTQPSSMSTFFQTRFGGAGVILGPVGGNGLVEVRFNGDQVSSLIPAIEITHTEERIA